jgi:hypothetical protein
MIFAFATDDRTLLAFSDEAEATAYAEGVDVEKGVWLFFAHDGCALEAVFTTPNQNGLFTIRSGSYTLRPNKSPKVPSLLELLPRVSAVEGKLGSVEDVRQFLSDRLSR